jgi:hypothetical protein
MVMIRLITVQCWTRRLSQPDVAVSLLPADQNTRRLASRNRSSSCGSVRMSLVLSLPDEFAVVEASRTTGWTARVSASLNAALADDEGPGWAGHSS